MSCHYFYIITVNFKKMTILKLKKKNYNSSRNVIKLNSIECVNELVHNSFKFVV